MQYPPLRRRLTVLPTQAGLLTSGSQRVGDSLPISSRDSGSCRALTGYSGGTVQDLHLIPYYPSIGTWLKSIQLSTKTIPELSLGSK